MVPRAKCHLRINHNIIFRFWIILMERTVNNTSTIKNNRLKIIPFPLFIPIPICDVYYLTYFHSLIFKAGNQSRKLCLIKKRTRYIPHNTGIYTFKTFKSIICQ